MIPTLVVAAVLGIVAGGQREPPAPQRVILQGATGVRINEAGGVVSLAPASGWVRSHVMYSDFVLAFEYRRLEPGTEIVVTVRSQRRDAGVMQGEAFVLSSPGTSVADAWQRVEIRADSTRVTLSVGGQSTTQEDDRLFAGFVMFQVRKGSAEFRDLMIAPIVRPWQRPEGIVTGEELKARGGKSPRLVREVKPSYSRGAMRALIQGEVHMEAVVLTDGSVGAVHVTRSLHPDLDREAVATLKKWKFAPASVDGVSVPTVVEVEMTFTLK